MANKRKFYKDLILVIIFFIIFIISAKYANTKAIYTMSIMGYTTTFILTWYIVAERKNLY